MKPVCIFLCLYSIVLNVSAQVRDMRYVRMRDSAQKANAAKTRLADTNSKAQPLRYRQNATAIRRLAETGADTAVPTGPVQVLLSKTKFQGQAQYFVHGTVKQPSGIPIPGFIILLQGTTTQATTDSRGNFSMSFKKGGVLEFSHPGYVTIVISPETDPTFTNNLMTITMSVQVLEDHIKITVPKESLNVFPIPFPTPSGIYELEPGTFQDVSTLEGVDALLRQALDNCLYTEKRYYYAPHGFALVTEMEQTDATGVSMDPPDRWSAHISAPMNNPIDYIKGFFSVPAGYFRVFVFLVTDADVYASGSGIDEDDARKWLDQGYSSLPNVLKQTPLTTAYTYQLLVYQYKKSAGENGEKFTGITAQENFFQSHLSRYLTQKK